MTEFDPFEEFDEHGDAEISELELASISALLTEIDDDDRARLAPPPSIWNAIADTVASDRTGRPGRGLVLKEDGNGAVVTDINPIIEQATATISLASRRSDGEHHSLPSETGSWRRQWLPVAAAVAIAVVGGLVTWAYSGDVTGSDQSDLAGQRDGVVVGAVELSNNDMPVSATESARAELVEVDEQYFVDIDVPDLPPADGFYELWIIDVDGSGMFSLGVVTGDARFALPGPLDPADFPLVDVSVEPIDGDPTHSGQSIWRGELDL